jgi:hypothetical protein
MAMNKAHMMFKKENKGQAFHLGVYMCGDWRVVKDLLKWRRIVQQEMKNKEDEDFIIRSKDFFFIQPKHRGRNHEQSRVFLPTGIFIPLPSGNGIPQRYKWYTAIYRSNSKSKPKWPIQTVRRGIPWYKLFIPLRYELKPLRIALKPCTRKGSPAWKK